MKAEITAAGTISFKGRFWSDEFPASKLPGWIKFYDEMYKRKGFEKYKQTTTELKRIQTAFNAEVEDF